MDTSRVDGVKAPQDAAARTVVVVHLLVAVDVHGR
jgi:hypothetical protein